MPESIARTIVDAIIFTTLGFVAGYGICLSRRKS